MKEFDQSLIDTIQELADYFALQTVQTWASNIKRRKIINTKRLLNSLDYDTQKDLSKLVVVMQFAFEEYGRFADIKNVRWRDQPPIDEIKAWIEKKGLQAFMKDPNPNKKKPKTPERRKNEIAWGIARNRAKNKNRPKRKPWFQSTFYKSLNALYEEISIGVQDRSIEVMKETLLFRLKRGATTQTF